MKRILQPRRIREGRLFRNLTQADVAEGIGVTKQSVSQYETGVLEPSTETLEKISDFLDFPLSFFSKPYADDILTPVFFRKRKTSTKKLMTKYRTYIGWMTEVYRYIESYIQLPKLNLLTSDKVFYTTREISSMATKLRRYWGLGDGPISNLTLLLENNGIIISKVGLEASKVDACSLFFTSTSAEKRPMIFLASGTSAVRSRRDLAHELGHQVLHSWMDNDEFAEHQDIIEKEAETFASYFLMPEAAMQRECYMVKNVDSLLLLKKRWGASVQSILYHLAEMECISEGLFEKLKNQIYRRGWRCHEPGDEDISQERPDLINDAMTMLIDNHVKTPQDILNDLSMPADDVAALCGMDTRLFEIAHKRKPRLELVK